MQGCNDKRDNQDQDITGAYIEGSYDLDDFVQIAHLYLQSLNTICNNLNMPSCQKKALHGLS